jgi:2-oxoglutarate dehydrogenase E1 component
VHGDAAFAGQGVVMETLNLAQTRGYGTFGTVHIVINNQIGFTTSDPRDKGSTTYCSDVVKMIEAPVLHVNGDDPDAVVFATQIALEFRQKFAKDVVVDIICFRRLGHNEQDTPALTQPLMYKKIAQHPGTRKLYADKLAAQGLVPAGYGDEQVKRFRDAMDEGRHTADPVLSNFKSKFAVDWMPFLNRKWTDAADTAVPKAELKRIAERITSVPATLKIHPLVEKVIADRRAMAAGDLPLDWGMGEHLAYATLLSSGYGVRLSGQDSGRGTFHVHRHAVLHDQNREKWDRLLHPAGKCGRQPGAVHRHRLGAVRGGRAGLRVRLCHRRAQHAGDLGSAVRRLRQRRAGRDRPVHQLGRNQVGPGVGPDDDAAARL